MPSPRYRGFHPLAGHAPPRRDAGATATAPVPAQKRYFSENCRLRAPCEFSNSPSVVPIKPLVAAHGRVHCAEDIRRRDAVAAGAARQCTRRVGGRHRQRKTGMQRQNAACLPAADHPVQHLVHLPAERPIAAHRQVVDGVGDKIVSGIVVARTPFRGGIVNVLLIVVTLARLAALPVVTAR